MSYEGEPRELAQEFLPLIFGATLPEDLDEYQDEDYNLQSGWDDLLEPPPPKEESVRLSQTKQPPRKSVRFKVFEYSWEQDMDYSELAWMQDFFSGGGEYRDEAMYRLWRWHQLSFRQIGQVFGITEKAVLVHIRIHQQRAERAEEIWSRAFMSSEGGASGSEHQ
jgi:hypothetical protein